MRLPLAVLLVASCADAFSARPPSRAARVVPCSAEQPGPWRRVTARSRVLRPSARPPSRAARIVTCSAEHAGPSWRRIAARSGVFTAAAISVGAAPFLGEGQRQLGLVQAADASALKRFGDYALDDKIASIPCFMITNSGGSPYLKTTNEGNQQVIIFMDIRDAEAHLGEVRARGRARAPEASRSWLVSLVAS